jgi:hypothetical protein
MTEDPHENWKDVCSAVIEAENPDELLKLVVQLNQILERDEQESRDSIKAVRGARAAQEETC